MWVVVVINIWAIFTLLWMLDNSDKEWVTGSATLFSVHSDDIGTWSMSAFSKISYVIHIINISSLTDHFKYFIWYVRNVTTEIWLHFVQVLFFQVLMYRTSRTIRHTFFPEKCDLNSTCVLYVEGKYLFPNLWMSVHLLYDIFIVR